MPTEIFDRNAFGNYNRQNMQTPAQQREIREGVAKSLTPSGPVHHHLGTFSVQKDMPEGYNPTQGRWRSYGAWFESMRERPPPETRIDYGTADAKQFWPYGDQIIRLKGCLDDHTFKIGDVPVIRHVPETLHGFQGLPKFSLKETRIPTRPNDYNGDVRGKLSWEEDDQGRPRY